MTQFKPHKAENADLASLRFPAICLPKVDGVRGCYLTSQFTGRTLKAFKNRNVTDFYSHPLLRGFDGELAHGEITNPNQDLCRNTTGLVNSLGYNTDGSIPDLYVFDYVTEHTKNMPYSSRWELAKGMVDEIISTHREFSLHLKIMPAEKIVNSIEEVEAYHLEMLQLGFEGTIVRYLSAPHKNGRCTVKESYFMRIKEFATEEGKIVGYSEAQENRNAAVRNKLGYIERSSHQENKIGKGMIGSLTILRPNGDEITVGPGKLTHKERLEWFENPQLFMGKTATYKFMPYGTFNKPRFALFENLRADEDL